MQAGKLTAIGALALSALASRAQDIPAGPVKLAINLKAGQTRVFTVVNETVLSTIVPGAEAKKTTTKSSGTFELSVDSVNPDGSYIVRVRPTKQAVTVNGKDSTIPDGADAEVKATLGRDGRFRDATGKPDLKDDTTSPMDGEDFLNTVFDKEASLPERPVAIGDTWKDKVDSPIDETQPKMTVNNRLVGLDAVDSTPVARLLRVIYEPLQAPSEPGITASGKMEGGGLATLDLATGLISDERDTLRLTMDIDAQNPANAAQKVHIQTVADIKVRVQSSAPPAK